MLAMEGPEDAHPERMQPGLWAKLLEGRVTEVYVPGFECDTFTFLPQTLGLEIIDSRAYTYDREGVPRDGEQLGEVARQLSSEPRWIAGGGPWFWDAQFAARAEVILIYLLEDERWHLRNNMAPTDYAARAVRWLWQRRVARRREKAGIGVDRALPGASFFEAVSSRSVRSPMEAAVENVLTQYPEKVFVVAEWDTDQRLPTVRARRH